MPGVRRRHRARAGPEARDERDPARRTRYRKFGFSGAALQRVHRPADRGMHRARHRTRRCRAGAQDRHPRARAGEAWRHPRAAGGAGGLRRLRDRNDDRCDARGREPADAGDGRWLHQHVGGVDGRTVGAGGERLFHLRACLRRRPAPDRSKAARKSPASATTRRSGWTKGFASSAGSMSTCTMRAFLAKLDQL